MNQRNIQHRTPNAEHRMAPRIFAHFGVRCSMLDVRCFPSAPGFQRANVHFGEISPPMGRGWPERSEEHTSELQSQSNLVCRLLLEQKKDLTWTALFAIRLNVI